MSTDNLHIPQDRLADFCTRWKIIELALFGSVLRDDFGPDSDVDILVTFEQGAPWSLWDIVRVKHEFEEMVGRKVDIIERPALEKHHNPYLKREILSSAVRIFAA